MSQKSAVLASARVMIIVASTRPGRRGPAVASWFADVTRAQAEQANVRVDIADLAEVGLPLLDEPEHPSSGTYVHEHTRAWSRRVAVADAFVVVTPEYNYGMPATLKNAIDYLYREWAWKPVGFVSYGNTSAGTRSVQMVKQVVTTLKMVPIGATVALRIAEAIPDGVVRANQAAERAACEVLSELIRVAHALRPLRTPGPNGSVAGAALSAAPVVTDDTPPVAGLVLAPAGASDVAELLVLQRCCWVEEAVANDTLRIPPLHETPADVAAWLTTWQAWVVRRHGRLVGAVRARAEGTVWEIGRLMVAPDLAGQGVGRWLLAYAERQAPPETTTCALFTGHRSRRNIGLYQRAGYTLTPAPADQVPDTVYLTKPRPTDAAAAAGVDARLTG